MATKTRKQKGRRGRGEGSIFERGDGTWTATISLGYDGNGRRKRRTVYGATKQEVQGKLTKLQSQKLDGSLGDANRLTVAEFLARWLQDVVRTSAAGTTAARYESIVRKHVN